MSSEFPPGSPRRAELLDACYAYLLEHGLTGLSLRPLAAATGTSPGVLLYLFGSKENLVRDLLARARREQITLIANALDPGTGRGFEALADRLWNLLSAPGQRAMVRLTYEAFLRSVSRDPGPWQGFAAETAQDWLDLLIRAQPDTPHDVAEATATRTLALIRGLLLDLLADPEPGRVTAAVQAGRWQPVLSVPEFRGCQAGNSSARWRWCSARRRNQSRAGWLVPAIRSGPATRSRCVHSW
jgi:AcrR family transcriptional regulator